MLTNVSYASRPLLCSSVFNYHHPLQYFGVTTRSFTPSKSKFEDTTYMTPSDILGTLRSSSRRISLLDNVKTFLFACGAFSINKWPWLIPCIQRVLIHLFNSPSVSKIRLKHFMGLPSIFLSDYSNLKHFEYYWWFHVYVWGLRHLCPPPKILSHPMVREWIYNKQTKKQTNGLPKLDLSIPESLSIFISYFTEEGYLPVGHILRLSPKPKYLRYVSIIDTSHSACSLILVHQKPCLYNLGQVPMIVLPTLRSFTFEWRKWSRTPFFSLRWSKSNYRLNQTILTRSASP